MSLLPRLAKGGSASRVRGQQSGYRLFQKKRKKETKKRKEKEKETKALKVRNCFVFGW
jgi:hypothetical protein